VIEEQFVVLTSIIPPLTVLEEHETRKARNTLTKRERVVRVKNADASSRKTDKGLGRGYTTLTVPTPCHEVSETEVRGYTYAFSL